MTYNTLRLKLHLYSNEYDIHLNGFSAINIKHQTRMCSQSKNGLVPLTHFGFVDENEMKNYGRVISL